MVTPVFAMAAEVEAPAAADFRWSPAQVSFSPQIQIVGKQVPIYGLKLNVGVGDSDLVWGADLGLLSREGELRGLQANLGNCIETKALGLQLGLVNGAKDFTGLAIGAANWWDTGTLHGAAVGLANITGEVVGAQLGVFNYCKTLTGAQVGLVNVVADKKIPFYPFLNVTW
jgi:hypothetical protein